MEHRIANALLTGLTPKQKEAVSAPDRRLLVVAGAGSGKTEVMARRIAWWIGVEGVPKGAIVAFTFTERAAEEMKFRIRTYIEMVTPAGADVTLDGMYVGTIHGFCLQMLRELRPDIYHNFDILDEGARSALVAKAYAYLLGLKALQSALASGYHATIEGFLRNYDLLNEFGLLDVTLSSAPVPSEVGRETDWCKEAELGSTIGLSAVNEAFARSAARYYAYLRCRRFLDFSTSQSELLSVLKNSDSLSRIRERFTHVVVDEVQDINPVQDQLIRTLVGDHGSLTAVGDHRQAIYNWRGGKVDIMGQLYEDCATGGAGNVVELEHNFRSTPRIVAIANAWAATISPVRTMSSPDMIAGNGNRIDSDLSHVAAVRFPTRDDEAQWIASAIRKLVRTDQTGAQHDSGDEHRGLTYGDVAILVRSSSDARTYMKTLAKAGIPSVVRAGPDLFSQPEVLLFVGVLARMASMEVFYGAEHNPKSLPSRINSVLNADPNPESVIKGACRTLREMGYRLDGSLESRLVSAADLLNARITGKTVNAEAVRALRSSVLREYLSSGGSLRRVFPQALYQMLLAEAEVGDWADGLDASQTVLFHLGQLSKLLTGIETPGWTSATDFQYQVMALCMWGTNNAKVEESPLLVAPDAVTVSTIHSVKGLEFAAVFIADVCASRFPSSRAKTLPTLYVDHGVCATLDPNSLCDNANNDSERRLMYVALTRAEKYLFVSASGQRQSKFFKEVVQVIASAGGTTMAPSSDLLSNLVYFASSYKRDVRLVTSFSDLRYYLECPHDFYLRKVLGFAPTIDQAFGYGRGVHNLMRAIHTEPEKWAALASVPGGVATELQKLIDAGLFYLRYTTGEPVRRMRAKAIEIIENYVDLYSQELATLSFEPEREFETLIPEEQVLVSGAMDVIRLDDPPRVSLIDFKSGEQGSDLKMSLTKELMELQVAVYGIAAKHELEYEPDQGYVRYLAEENPAKRQLTVPMTEATLSQARATVVAAARSIRDRRFDIGPHRPARNKDHALRCAECDFLEFCGKDEAKEFRNQRAKVKPSKRAARSR